MKERNSKVGQEMKRLRGDDTQQKFAYGTGVTREAISKYETGRVPVPPDISRGLMQKYDDARFAITVQQEYTGTGPMWLNGPNVDLHRSAVKEKTLEEIHELLTAMRDISLAKPLGALKPFEFQELEELLQEAAEAMTALDHLIAVLCQESGIKYTDVWKKHYLSLMRSGYINELH